MANGIIICGPNGSGKTTLGKALAEALGYKHMDIEDYYFTPSDIPYTKARSREDVQALLLADMEKYQQFVLSVVNGDLGAPVQAMVDCVVVLSAPLEIRLQRIKQRAYAQFGDRVLVCGDLYGQEQAFLNFVATRSMAPLVKWLETLSCPVLSVDGTRAISDNVELITRQLQEIKVPEIWDLYFRDGSLTGKDFTRGNTLPVGYYHMVCETLLRHTDGDFLIMQRSFSKPENGGLYEATAGGSALKGECAEDCARRELKEETGLDAFDFQEVNDLVADEDNCLFHSFVATTDCDKNTVKLQANETIGYKWLSEPDFKAFIQSEQAIKVRLGGITSI